MMVKFRDTARCMAHRAAHHRDEEATFRQRVKIVGNCGQRRVCGSDEPGGGGVRDVPEENFFLPLEHTEQAAASCDTSVSGEADMVKLVSRCTGIGQRCCGDHLPVVPGILVKIDDSKKIRVGA